MSNANGKNTEKFEAALVEAKEFGFNFGKGQTARWDVYNDLFTRALAGVVPYEKVEQGGTPAQVKKRNEATPVGRFAKAFLEGERQAVKENSNSAKNIVSAFHKIAEFATNGVEPKAQWTAAQKRQKELAGEKRKVQDLAKVIVNLSRASLKAKAALEGDALDNCILVKSSTKTLHKMLSGEKAGMIAIAQAEAAADLPEDEAEVLATLIAAAQDYLAVYNANHPEKGATPAMAPDEVMESFVRKGLFVRLPSGNYKRVAA